MRYKLIRGKTGSNDGELEAQEPVLILGNSILYSNFFKSINERLTMDYINQGWFLIFS